VSPVIQTVLAAVKAVFDKAAAKPAARTLSYPLTNILEATVHVPAAAVCTHDTYPAAYGSLLLAVALDIPLHAKQPPTTVTASFV